MIETYTLLFQNSPALRAGLFFILGACLGSFMTALAYRLPRGLDWVSDRSRCTSCGHALGMPDLVPIFSWVFLRGRCRHCGADVSARYPAIELAFATASALAAIFCL